MGDLGSRVLVSFRFDRVCFDDVRTTCRFLDLGQYCVLCLSSSATVPLPMAIDIVLVGIVLVRLKIEVLGSDVPKMFSVGPSHSSTLRPKISRRSTSLTKNNTSAQELDQHLC